MFEDYEPFTEAQKKTLSRYVTNTQSNIFVLFNLPEVIKGALFSRYSRSSLGLRSLLLKEFIINNDETSFVNIVGLNDSSNSEVETDSQTMAIKKAQNFYDRILDGYGDDSIGELGGAHLAIENVSVLAAKIVEDARIGGSPLEKSTRYIYFDQKMDNQYLFFREPILMTSAYRDLYLNTCNKLFDTYSQLIPPLTELLEKRNPKEHEVSKTAYNAALRAKVLDCLRGLLPTSALTNLGVYGNGRFFESLLQKLNPSSLNEMQEISRKAHYELNKVIPSFIRRADINHKYQKSFSQFSEQLNAELKALTTKLAHHIPPMSFQGIKLVSYDKDSPFKVASALLFSHSNAGLKELQDHCQNLTEEQLSRILDAAASFRENRRHKSPRALEHANFTFEITADFGVYRDLQRHRILTQERQLLTCNHGYDVPNEIIGTAMENPYRDALEEAKQAYDTICKDFPEEAQYVVPMAYNIHWYFHVNLRSLQWLCELRSSAAGHPNYRYIAQEMAKLVSQAIPLFERFFKFVDFGGYEYGRLSQEIRTAERLQARNAHV